MAGETRTPPDLVSAFDERAGAGVNAEGTSRVAAVPPVMVSGAAVAVSMEFAAVVAANVPANSPANSPEGSVAPDGVPTAGAPAVGVPIDHPATTPGAGAGGSRSTSSAPPLSHKRSQAMQELLEVLSRGPEAYDFFQVLRRMESIYRDRPERPRFGAALRPADEPIRLGQEPSLSFAPAALSALRPGRQGLPPRLAVHFFGLLGPNGPLPMHLTEYARDRMRNSSDPTMSRFMDVFHHRMLMFFYRAWASGEPTASHDNPQSNRFFTYVGAAVGRGLPSLRGWDKFPESAKLFYAGQLSAQARNVEGLQAMIADFFQMPARVEPFMGDWLDLPLSHRWRLGVEGPGGVGRLGMSTTLGARAWSRQQKFRVVMGPLERAQFQRMLPGGASLAKLTALVRNYIGDELRWDLRLFLKEEVEHPFHLGQSRMGWTTWLGRAEGRRREDLILDPQTEMYGAA